MADYCDYYHNARTHRSLGQDAPNPRVIEAPEDGKIIELPMVGGLHHRYGRLAAWYEPVPAADRTHHQSREWSDSDLSYEGNSPACGGQC